MAWILTRRGRSQGPLPPTPIRLLLGVLLYAAVLPRFSELPMLLWALYTGYFVLYLSSIWQTRLQPGRATLLLLTIAGVALIQQHYRTLFGYEAGIALLACMVMLKLLEIKSPRDVYVAAVLGLFFLVAQFLLNQSMYLGLYSLLVVWGITATLDLFNGGPGGLKGGLRRAAGYLVQTLPLVLVLFLLFPRLSTPLWNLQLRGNTGVTGLSDSMAPGSISELIRSGEPVFRVEFDAAVPARERLYWRGPVLWDYDGHRWTGAARRPARSWRRIRGLDPVSYRMIVEPSTSRWITALDLPASAPVGVAMTADRHLVSERDLDKRIQLHLRSFTRYDTGPITPRERTRALRLPTGFPQRVRALGQGWRAGGATPQAVVDKALAYFRSRPFVYTLKPPAATGDPTAYFLFQSRAGFCEHYASAFTLLMRSAGIPSRVVTGYLGGELNTLGGYLIVRQSDAHAWSEVWMQGRGWVRVDPTAAIAPERILDSVLFSGEDPGAPVSYRSGSFGPLQRLWARIAFTLDAANTQWHIWVLAYDTDRQTRLLDWLGLGGLHRYAAALASVVAGATVMALLAWGLLGRPRRPSDPVVRLYRRFGRRLARLGLAREPWEGPRDYGRRAARARPDLAREILAITELYLSLRYAGRGGRKTLAELARRVARFRPGRP